MRKADKAKRGASVKSRSPGGIRRHSLPLQSSGLGITSFDASARKGPATQSTFLSSRMGFVFT